VSTPNSVDLRRPRDLGALLSDGFGTYFRNFGKFLAIAAAVVVPIQLILSGVGLGQLFSHYDKTPSLAVLILPSVVSFLVTAPLVTAMTIYALLELGEGRPPSARRAIQSGLDVFAPLFLAVVLAGIGIAAGLALLLLPGVFLAVRWYFVPEAVVVEGLRGTAALQRSWDLVKGSGWRVFAIVLVTALAIGAATNVLQQIFVAIADSTGRSVYQLIGVIVTQTLATPATAVVGALLYFDLRARREAPAAPPGGYGAGAWEPPPPAWPAQPPRPQDSGWDERSGPEAPAPPPDPPQRP
jgi:hypothetical protein